MPDASWKRWEREASAALGGTRSGPMGTDLPDCANVPLVAPEFKYYKRLIFLEEDWKQASENAAKIGKIPILAIKERGGKRKRVEMDWDDFVTLYHLSLGGLYASQTRPSEPVPPPSVPS